MPKLYQLGFRGPIFATSATVDLCSAMLPDSAHIQEKDVRYVNRRHRRKGLPEVEPLYGMADAEAVLELFEEVGYGATFSPRVRAYRSSIVMPATSWGRPPWCYRWTKAVGPCVSASRAT